ncbi:methionyl-tRNA formyltransferase [Bizionia sediminis]|uniref:Methionyl-tRNA formyltransferase n=1 Tax=Bizionia sediminis TaxID=1737064 RepID=A0ABW5KSV2_9FLAO
MKTNLRIVFMGTPDFAVASLQNILHHGYHVVGVVTAPDKPAGRGRKLQASAVKQFALKNKLTILQPTNLKDPDFINALEALNANVQIVVAFRMLPKVVWQMPQLGTFNLHASLLPNYRGAAPINWAIINGETETGVSTFFIDEKIDTGAVILQKAVKISDSATAGSLHDALMETGSALVIDTLQLIETNQVSTVAQPKDAQLKDAPKLNKANCAINWQAAATTIYNHVRGLNPYPAAWTTLVNGSESLEVKIYDVHPILEAHNHAIGHIQVNKKALMVAVADGYIAINEMKLPGKRKMAIRDLLNGYEFLPDAKML